MTAWYAGIPAHQALLEVNIGGTKLGQVVLLSTQFLTEAILGLDFLISYEAEISLPERRITLRVNEELFNFEFTGVKETSANRFCDLGLMSIHPQTQHPSTVNKGHCYTKNFAGVWMSQFRIGKGKMVRIWKTASAC